jgi:hypothetical protein
LGQQLATAVQKRRAFWLVDIVSARLRDRALLLHDNGIEVQFFTNVDSFLRELDVKRAGIIVVSDYEEPASTEKVLSVLMNTPEIQGAKMIYICKAAQTDLRMLAAGLGFRDVIPEDLEDRQWLQRFRFATAARPAEYRQPAIQTSVHEISGVSLPARVVWISDTQIRVECRLRAPVGASFSFSGPLAQAFGVSSLSLTVKSTARSNLLYRFSDALICDWTISASHKERAGQVMKAIRTEDPGPRCRIFVAVQNSVLRREILSQFDDPRFEIATAMQKQSIASDPRFFSPDMVLIESSLCSLTDNSFVSMMDHLPEHTAVIIFGKIENFSALRARYSPRTVVMLTSVPRDITTSALNRFMPIRLKIEDVSASGGSYLATGNPMSIGEVSFSARLNRIHPSAIGLALPFPVANFALVRVDCPYIRKSTGRNMLMKVTRVYRNMADSTLSHAYQIDGYVADASPADQRRLADTIVATQTEALKIYQPDGGTRQEVSFYRIPVAVPPPPQRDEQQVQQVQQAPAAPVRKPIVPAVASIAEATESARQIAATIVDSNRSEQSASMAVGSSYRSEAPVQKNTTGKDFVRMAQRFAEPAIDLDDDDQFKLKEELAPMLEAAADIKDEFVQGIRDGVQSDIFKSIAAIFLTILSLVTVLWIVANHIAPAWEKSGMQYSERLKDFAPHLKQKKPDADKK